MSVLPLASTPPPVCSGGGGIDVDGTAASEAFFFGGMLMKENEHLARVNAGSGSQNLDAPYLAPPAEPKGARSAGPIGVRGSASPTSLARQVGGVEIV